MIAVAIFFMAFGKANAQVEVTYGPELGGSIVGIVDDNEATYAGFDGQLGGAAHVQIGRFFAVRPAVFFRTASMFDAYDESYKMSLLRTGINMPLLFSYNFNNNGKVYVGAGPSLMFNVGGKFDEYGEKRPISFGTTEDDDMKPVDFGLHMKAGFQFSSGLALNLFFGTSLGDLNPVPSDYGGKLKTMDALGFSIGWMFGGNGSED